MRAKEAFWLTALFVLGIGAAATYWRFGSLLAAPAHRSISPPPPFLSAENVSITSTSGSELAAWYSTPEDPKAAVVLLHCVRCSRTDMLPRAELLWRNGFAILLPDLQAHGESPGKAITFGYLESKDAVASVRYLRQRHPDLPIGAVGVSLGGAALTLAAESIQVDALVLEAVYPTIEEAVANRIAIRLGLLSKILAPALLLQLGPRLGISPNDLRPVDHIASVSCPVLVAAGALDRHTTEVETRRLFAAAPTPKRLWVVPGAAHQDLLRFDPEGYASTVLAFLNEHLAGRPNHP